MADKDFAPLSASCVRSLNDKLYEKRKVAALEIEKLVKDYAAHNNTAQIRKLLKVLGQDFTLSHNPNSRKGGLIGLAATAIALSKDSSNYVVELVKPVLTCFFDSDSRVRYYGCEALYNIVKVARGSVLPFFNEIFDGLSKLAADPDQNVRSGSELLDRLMKDIVTESCQFDLVSFIPLLRERVYTKNPFARQFVVSWIMTLDAVPDIDMIVFLPEIIDGLFCILGDSSTEIRKMCEAALGELLRGVIDKEKEKVDYPAMVNIIISHSQAEDPVIQYVAILWLREFVKQSGRIMLPYASGILTAILPCLSYDEKRRNIKEVSRGVNGALQKLVGEEDDNDLSQVAEEKQSDKKNSTEQNTDKGGKGTEKVIPSKQNTEDERKATEKEKSSEQNTDEGEEATNDVLEKIKSIPIQLDIPSAVQVLTRHLIHDSMATRIAALRWIFHLFNKTPNKMFRNVDELFPLLLKTLSDPSDEVVLLDLEVLAEISSNSAGIDSVSQSCHQSVLSAEIKKAIESTHGMNSYFTRFMVDLLAIFSTDRQLLEDRGSFIIRQLCLLLYAEDIYRCCSEILLKEEDGKFASHMIQTLSTILLTSTELFDLRTQLKDLNTQESCTLFCCLYKSWCHNPVSTVSLCFLTQNYNHACQLLTMFGDLEVTVDFLTEIDKLVQLIESPIFTYLRLQLLDIENNHHLVKSLYGLLMLLPQSEAFHTLRHRLQCIPCIHPPDHGHRSKLKPENPFVKKIDFKKLLEHFQKVQEQHRKARRQPHTLDSFIH